MSQNSLATRKLITRTHRLECQVQVEFKNLAVNTALHLSYDGYLCKEVLFQLKAIFYKVLYCINNLQLCPLVFLYTGACIVLSLVKIMQLCYQVNPHHVPSEKVFTDRKYVLPLKNYGDFNNFVHLASRDGMIQAPRVSIHHVKSITIREYITA